MSEPVADADDSDARDVGGDDKKRSRPRPRSASLGRWWRRVRAYVLNDFAYSTVLVEPNRRGRTLDHVVRDRMIELDVEDVLVNVESGG